MAVRKRFINSFAHRESPSQSVATHRGIEASPNSKLPLDETGPNSTDEEIINEKAQSDTQKAQASSQSWTRIPWMQPTFCQSTLQSINHTFPWLIASPLSPYIYKGFELHSMIGLASVFASLISALVKFPYAKLMDIWGQLKPVG
ncbi:hypothetical protein PENARI_c002G08437 [Penicillium arizonense]|uniref:Uncharacterized protein n=1 Tax=Penicillium arizonense TaxID=1835702 RepID=A0A1F5LUG7_PENAI|nr:hypothetical protein PENARI_c002G08437 [Penicillium arizonense]OGE56835.1 hypothetical protein PENARI_c002G08437 [Penicillium arizonense]